MPLKVIPRRDRKLHRQVKRGHTLVLRKGEVLYHHGDKAHHLYLIRTGHLQLVVRTRSGRERIQAVAGPWEMAGEEGLFPGSLRRTEGRAGERLQVTMLDGAAVTRALRTGSRTYGAFLRAKEAELTLARKQAEPRRAGGARRQLAALLLDLSDRLGRSEGEKGTRIPIRLTHQALADLSGCHRSTVTTILNDWIYEGFLRQEEGHLRIVKSGALADLEAAQDPGGGGLSVR